MKYEVKLSSMKAQQYTENKEVVDKIIQIIAKNKLTRKQTESLFCDIKKLLRNIPFIPAEEPIEFAVEEIK